VAALSRVLVANRGEIACRIVRACHAEGIEAIVAHSDADAAGLAVRSADGAVRLGPDRAEASYLDPSAVVRAARAAGCDAVHPGYGFLAERADLAEALLAAGLVFVGPSADALRALGDKRAARGLARAAGFVLVPGGDDPAAVGLPLLVKAAAGGGGRGMRIVREAAELEDALAAARREALAAFGDGTVYAERLVEHARHVEVQTLGDGAGGALAVGLRDCSAQRRHQKVVEEAPAPGIGQGDEAALTAAACRLLAEVGYAGAATVELLRAPDGATYFIEANARLQVEHPVTELVRGVDLVRWQLRIAAGERLPEAFEPGPGGHAVEARLIAEDADAGYVPSAGRLLRFDLPAGDGLRVDAGYEAGDDVPPFYDGLLAKLVAHGRDRAEAVARLRTAVGAVVVLGVQTNLPLLAALLDDPGFRAAELDTGIVERAFAPRPDAPAPAAVLAAAAAHAARGPLGSSAFAGGFRLGHAAVPALPVATAADGGVHVLAGGREHRLPPRAAPDVAEEARRAEAAHAPGEAIVAAPLPGRIAALYVDEGAQVDAGDVVLVLEAMKMEHPVTAPYAGVVAALRCAVGDLVRAGQPLVELA
jgi:acetyl/propionyl-CoA carboxylase alpha subunit